MKRFLIIQLILSMGLTTASAQCASYFGSDYSAGKVFLMKDNRVVWEHKAPDSNDLWVLPDGNFLFTVGRGVLEVTPLNDTVFYYASESPVYACQRLKNGNTFIGECASGRLLEVSPKGKIVKEVCILPEGTANGGGGFMRNARRLDNGNYLVAHYGSQKVTEYDPDGKPVWSADVPGGPHSVIRLKNGNTLVAVADMTQNPRIAELNPQGECVWEITNDDVPGRPFKFLGGMCYFPDGRLYFANWVGHEKPGESIHMFCVDKKNKEILCTQGTHEKLKTISSLFVLDKKHRKKMLH